MAYSNSTNYYESIIADSYSSNISGQILRIEDAHKAIRSKAIELGLKIPAGSKLTDNASGTTDKVLTNTHHLLDTAAAINNIPINTDSNTTIDAGDSYIVPVGYNASTYIITSSGLSGQTEGTATKEDILAGKTAWVNGSKIIGEMLNKTGNQTTSNYAYYTDSNNKSYLYLSIPETGKYSKDSELRSTIPYHTASEVEIPVTITTLSTGEVIAEQSIKSFPAGYYSGLNIKAVHKNTENKVINIDNTVGILNSQSGKLSITSGYDYFAADSSYSIIDAVVKGVTTSVDSETGILTFSGGNVTTAGWISTDITKPDTYIPTEAVFSKDSNTGLATVTTAGWVKKGTTMGGLSQGSATMSGPTKNTTGSDLQVGQVNIAKDNYYMKLVTTAGYINNSTTGINLGLATFKDGSSTSTKTNDITSKKWYVTISQGYNNADITKVFEVKDGTINPQVSINSDYQGSLTVSEGWISGGSVNLQIPAKNQSYALIEDDLTETDHVFTVSAASGTLMKSLNVDTKIIFDKLVNI